METENRPQETGYYWAKTNGYKWYNIIVQVYGDFPFFKVNGYDFSKDKGVTDISQIAEFGNRIECEE